MADTLKTLMAQPRALETPGPLAWCQGLLCGPPAQYRVACCLCCCPPLIGVAAAAGFGIFSLVLLSPFPLQVVELVLAIIGVLAALWWTVRVFKARESYGAAEVAQLLHDSWKGKTPGLPEQLRGVFWMSDNSAPEVMASWEGASFDPARRVMEIKNGGSYNWSWSTSQDGWVEWLSVAGCGPLFCSTLRFVFDADYKVGYIGIVVCCCNIAPCLCQKWTMVDISGEGEPAGTSWDRNSYCSCCGKDMQVDNYVLRKVVSGDGKKVQPAHDAMIESLSRPGQPGTLIKGKVVKTHELFVQGPIWAQKAPAQVHMAPETA